MMAKSTECVAMLIIVIYFRSMYARVISRGASNSVTRYECDFNDMTFDKNGKLMDGSTWKGNMDKSQEAKLIWKIKKGPTGAKTTTGHKYPDTGPTEDSDEASDGKGHYMYLDSRSGKGTYKTRGHLNGYTYQARFITPKFHVRCKGDECPVNEFSHCLQFNYHMRGLTSGSLTLKLRKDGDENHEKVIFRAVGEKSGNNRWVYVNLPLVGFARKDVTNVQLVIEAQTSYGLTSDIAVDGIIVKTYGDDGDENCQFPGNPVEKFVEPAKAVEYPENRETCGTPKGLSSGSKTSTDDLDGGSANIFNGRKSQPGQWPWMAMIKQKNKEQICGGTLLGKNAVVTAAHCVFDMEKKDDLYVRLGAYNYTESRDKNGINYNIKEVYVHPEYNGYSHDYQKSVWFNNDVAVLILDDVTFNNNIQSICLPDSSEIKENCHIAGWGATGDTSESNYLLQGKIEMVEKLKCYEEPAIFEPSKGEVISESMMCARGEGTDTCQGDSGGPLMCQMKSGQWALCGITSWGKKGCKNSTGIYTNVTQNDIQQWIRGVIKNRPRSNRLPFEGHNGRSVSVIQ